MPKTWVTTMEQQKCTEPPWRNGPAIPFMFSKRTSSCFSKSGSSSIISSATSAMIGAGVGSMIREGGAQVLFSRVSANTMLYYATRLGLYHHLKHHLHYTTSSSSPSSTSSSLSSSPLIDGAVIDGRVPTRQKLQAALLAGPLGTAAVNSAVCLQSQGRLFTFFKSALRQSRLNLARTQQRGISTNIAAGAAAGIVTATVSNPMDNIIRIAAGTNGGAASCTGSGAMLNCLMGSLLQSPLGLFKGFLPTLMCQTTLSVMLFAILEGAKHLLGKPLQEPHVTSLESNANFIFNNLKALKAVQSRKNTQHSSYTITIPSTAI